MTSINVKDTINNTIAMSTEDGQKLFHVLYENLKNTHKVKLSFVGIDILISHFLNESIGKLYEKFENWDILDKAIVYEDIDDDDLELLKEKVIPTAKNHFKNTDKTDKIDESILND
ncbi:STAS-like domain-containing protein [Aliarcobacter butzleri]|uniref:STAS-like domain-containing protein n=1 Tax=Aliarcobacter butzleri TaxID=28197 RepID=UPI00263C1292|nr:STAS-like domain-containing protein [Aliarcobacter butzleri]MDN5058239.1 STAS-like domain-containing protein [Aliarcobacter butzleri]